MRRVPWMLVVVAAAFTTGGASAGESGGHAAQLSGIAPPVLGKAVDVRVVSGAVRVRTRGSDRVVALESAKRIPVGSTVDARLGTAELTSAAGKTGGTQRGRFSGAVFVVAQSKSDPLTELSLKGGNLSACSRLPGGGAARVHRRRLSSSVHGSFRTRGRNAAATARGTKWTMTDTCSGTLTVVQRGTVDVRDLAKRTTVVVHEGKSYMARPPG